jgi:hypothetical protein
VASITLFKEPLDKDIIGYYKYQRESKKERQENIQFGTIEDNREEYYDA